MSSRKSIRQAAAKAGMLCGAIFLFAVLLAALPTHRAPAADPAAVPQSSAPSQEVGHPAVVTPDERANERAAVEDMSSGSEMHGAHMTMTAMRAQNPQDTQRAWDIVAQLRSSIEKYKDYHVALNDGFKIFLPNIPQPEYHFTNYTNGFYAAFTFDPTHPTSLLYKKSGTGYELAGAMYTMPRRATEDQLNARVPLSVAMWHLHTNLCMPASGQIRAADMKTFGLHGSISTKEACDSAGGRFSPVVFGWMTHVYPYETTLDKIFSMHMHMD